MVVSHQGGVSSGWSLIRVVSHQGGVSSGWSLLRVMSHQGFHPSVLSMKFTLWTVQVASEETHTGVTDQAACAPQIQQILMCMA